MKKQNISLVIIVVSLISIAVPIYSMGSRRTTNTAHRTTGAHKSNGLNTQKLNRVHFWDTVVKALKKDGYAADSLEMQHAQRYLQRAEARQKAITTRRTNRESHSRTKAARAHNHKNGTSSTLEHRARTTDRSRNGRQEAAFNKTAASRKYADHRTTRQQV